MNTQSVQPPALIDQDASKFGDMILSNASPEARRPVYEYGRYVLAGAEPTHGASVRFFGALYDLTPWMPGYAEHVATLKSSPTAISRFQSGIALHVLLHDKVVHG